MTPTVTHPEPLPHEATPTGDVTVVRLGGESEHAIDAIRTWTADTPLPLTFEIKCKQVPKELAPNALALIWLGTNNNKGGATPWVQGLRAVGRITGIEGDPAYNAEKTIAISVGLVLSESLTKKDFLRATGADYIRISDLPVLGVNNYSSQVIQKIDLSDPSQDLPVVLRAIAKLEPSFGEELALAYPDIAPLLAMDSSSNESSSSTDDQLIPAEQTSEPPKNLDIDIPSDDPLFAELLARVRRLLKDGFGGVIFRGPPGSGKSWYARRIGAALVDSDAKRIRFVQFHPSYQYEDFVEGMIADGAGVFRPTPRHFLDVCSAAEGDPEKRTYVIVIDELSRTDPARVFGEALTYLEASKRGEEFHLSSGRKAKVPSNVVVIGTMNVWDRGVDEVDSAVERRFASIALDPSRDALIALLDKNGLEKSLKNRIVSFFNSLQSNPNRMVRVGHAYFGGVRDESGLHRLWHHQLRFAVERAFALDPDGYKNVERLWDRLFPLTSAPADVDEAEPPKRVS